MIKTSGAETRGGSFLACDGGPLSVRPASLAPGRPPSLPVGPCRSPWVPLAPSGSDQWRNFLQCCTTLGITSRFTSRFFGVSLCSCQTAVSNCRSASESVAFDLLNFLPLYLSICFFLSFSPLFSCCWLWLRLLLGRAKFERCLKKKTESVSDYCSVCLSRRNREIILGI